MFVPRPPAREGGCPHGLVAIEVPGGVLPARSPPSQAAHPHVNPGVWPCAPARAGGAQSPHRSGGPRIGPKHPRPMDQFSKSSTRPARTPHFWPGCCSPRQSHAEVSRWRQAARPPLRKARCPRARDHGVPVGGTHETPRPDGTPRRTARTSRTSPSGRRRYPARQLRPQVPAGAHLSPQFGGEPARGGERIGEERDGSAPPGSEAARDPVVGVEPRLRKVSIHLRPGRVGGRRAGPVSRSVSRCPHRARSPVRCQLLRPPPGPPSRRAGSERKRAKSNQERGERSLRLARARRCPRCAG
jgi:hypothetical protein